MRLNENFQMRVIIINKDLELLSDNESLKEWCPDEIIFLIRQFISNGIRAVCLCKWKIELEILNFEDLYVVIFKNAVIEKDILIDESEFNQIITSSFDGIVICDGKGNITLQNPAAQRLTGLNRQFVLGKNLQELIDGGVIDHSATLKVLNERKPITIVQTFITGRKVLVTGVPIFNEKGDIKKVVCNLRDLTKLKKLEDEVLQLEKKNEIITRELEKLKEKQKTLNSIIAYDPKMKVVLDRAVRIARVDSTVLIYGESGAGKEGIVDYIHEHSNRKNGKLVKINCGAIPEHLLESELFGYVPGAFTGASHKGKEGLFQLASSGTIFLDEIAELPLSLQVKLLRVLQENKINKLGDTKTIKVDARIIVATNKDLKKLVELGEFREDLYYRLNIIPIYVPALRERKEDIIPLVYHFLSQMKEKYGINRIFSNEALQYFEQYDWPGNVRELRNVVERLSLMIEKPVIEKADVKVELSHLTSPNKTIEQMAHVQTTNESLPTLRDAVKKVEVNLIKKALHQYGTIRQAAIKLKVDPSTLSRKIQKYQLLQ